MSVFIIVRLFTIHLCFYQYFIINRLTQSQADALGVSKSISLYIELELIAFKKGPERWEMTQEQRLQVMERMKRRANSLVAAGLDTGKS